MNKLFVRVDLPGSPGFEVRAELCKFMEQQGFHRTVRTDSGESVKLLSDCFFGETRFTPERLAKRLLPMIRGLIWCGSIVHVAESGRYVKIP